MNNDTKLTTIGAVGDSSAAPASQNEDDPSSNLTSKQEVFCQAVVESGNQGFAYRRAYNVGPKTKSATVWREAHRLAQLPQVRRRIKELLDNAAANATVSKQRLIQFLWDRIMADRRSVINHVRRCCRFCHGINHQYQWKDELEHANALLVVVTHNSKFPDPEDERRRELPGDEGGFGFDPHAEPEPTCDSPQCMGDGLGKTVIVDTTTLTGDAALIYEGIKETAQGIEVKLADRNADMAQLSKLLGWSIEKVDASVNGALATGRGLPAEMYDIPSTCTPDEASKRYLALVM